MMGSAAFRWGSDLQLISYAFPVRNVEATLWLPRDGLTREEAERLKAYVDTLVTEGQNDVASALGSSDESSTMP